jgi:hypothetical protein
MQFLAHTKWPVPVAAGLLVFLAACAHSQGEREACYARSEAAAAQAALACPGSWRDCPDRPRILAELKAEQERCK